MRGVATHQDVESEVRTVFLLQEGGGRADSSLV